MGIQVFCLLTIVSLIGSSNVLKSGAPGSVVLRLADGIDISPASVS